jgi:surface protein
MPKRVLLGICILFFYSYALASPSDFITKWETTRANQSVLLRGDNDCSYSFDIDWGDGTVQTSQTSYSVSHTYATPGVYTITISGVYSGFERATHYGLISVEQWGDIKWCSMDYAFASYSSSGSRLTINATDTPDLSQATSMGNTFYSIENFTGSATMNDWNVSTITNMAGMFSVAKTFNTSLDRWDVSSVTNMRYMFGATEDFNQSLDSWDVSSVTDMSGMFNAANSFNQPLSSWDVSSVTDMSNMFSGADSFNQSINGWDVSSVTSMRNMFRNAKVFNQPLDQWDTSSVTNMNGMFSSSRDFNQSLNSWDVSSVTDMSDMFTHTYSFNQSLSNWDVSSVTTMHGMFNYARVFNQPLNMWTPIEVTDMSDMFKNTFVFNSPIEGWVTPKLTTTESMFEGADLFNQSLNDWNVSSVTNMKFMFATNYSSRESNFNQPLDRWDTSSVTDMSGMFHTNKVFNQSLNDWNTSSVKDISGMFYGADRFNQPLNNWDTSNVENMASLFVSADDFNQSVNDWNISNVTNMTYMFNNAISFNQPLDQWDVSHIDSFKGLFSGARSFNQPLDMWNVSNATTMYQMLDRSGLSKTNYDNLLIAWNDLNLQPNVELGARDLKYCAGKNARDNMINSDGWNITNDIESCAPEPPTDVLIDGAHEGSISEGVPSGSEVGVLTTSDPNAGDTHSYSFGCTTSGIDDSSFSIVGDRLRVNFVPDYASKDTYNICVRSSDGTFTYDQNLVINITDIDIPPSDVLLDGSHSDSIGDGSPASTIVGTLSTTDLDSSSFSYALGCGGVDNAYFSIENTADPLTDRLKTNFVANYATKDRYDICVISTDDSGLTKEQNLTVNITYINQRPTDVLLDGAHEDSIVENSPIGSEVGVLTTIDSDSISFAYSFGCTASGVDDSSFSIVGDRLQIGFVPDYESKASYDICVRSTDDEGEYHDQNLKVYIDDLDDNPTDVLIDGAYVDTIDENSPVGSEVGVLTTLDDDSINFTYSFGCTTSGIDDSSFVIDGDSVKLNTVPNYERKSIYNICVKSRGSTGQTYEQNLQIRVNNLDEPPTDILLDGAHIDYLQEGQSVGTLVGVLSTIDDDSSSGFSYGFCSPSGPDDANFSISGDRLRANFTADYESKSIYKICVVSTDSTGKSVSQNLTVEIVDKSENPTDVLLDGAHVDSVDENSAEYTVVGLLSTVDPDIGEEHSYNFCGGSDDSKFFIDQDNQVRVNFMPNYEQKSSYSICVRSTDSKGLYKEQSLTININDLEEDSAKVLIDGEVFDHIDENSPVDTEIGILTTVDEDNHNTFTYSFDCNTSSMTNFKIDGDRLKLNFVPNFEQQNTYRVCVRSTNELGDTFDQNLTIYIDDINDDPTDILIDGTHEDYIYDNTRAGIAVGILSTLDEDIPGDEFDYSFGCAIGGSDDNNFTIDGNQLISNFVSNIEQKDTYNICVVSSDNRGGVVEQNLVIKITYRLEELTVYPTYLRANSIDKGFIVFRVSQDEYHPDNNITFHTTGDANISDIVDNQNGVYTATITNETKEIVEVSAQFNNFLVRDRIGVTFTRDNASAKNSTITATPSIVRANGIDKSKITISLKDSYKRSVLHGGYDVTLESSSSDVKFADIIDHKNGTYTTTAHSLVPVVVTLQPFLDGIAFDSTTKITFSDYSDWLYKEIQDDIVSFNHIHKNISLKVENEDSFFGELEIDNGDDEVFIDYKYQTKNQLVIDQKVCDDIEYQSMIKMTRDERVITGYYKHCSNGEVLSESTLQDMQTTFSKDTKVRLRKLTSDERVSHIGDSVIEVDTLLGEYPLKIGGQ